MGMEKLGFAELLTLILVIFGGLVVLLHPEKWGEACSGLVGAIILIAFFIGYGNDK